MIKGLAIDKAISGTRDQLALVTWANYNKVPVKVVGHPLDAPSDYLPVGTVKFVESALFAATGLSKTRKVWRVVPDYYPEFLRPYLNRQVYLSDRVGCGERFVKPSVQYKGFEAHIAQPHIEFDHAVWMSDVIPGGFRDEWRYYVADGECVMAEWYKGITDTPSPAPELDIAWPANYCGAVDFGVEAESGRLTLVEAQHPFSCGYYGEISPKEVEKCVRWLEAGWKYMVDGALDGSIEVR